MAQRFRMSVDATRWAWIQCDIRSTDKLVLLSLADRADEHHRCWPGVARLSADTLLDRKTVMAAIGRLEKAGLVLCDRHHGVGTVYTLRGVTGRETGAKTGTGTKNGTSTKNGTGPVPKTVLPPVPKTGHKPKREPNKNLKGEMLATFPELEPVVAEEFIGYRKSIKAPLTLTAWARMSSEIRKTGMSAGDVLAEVMSRGWRGFRADWMESVAKGGARREL